MSIEMFQNKVMEIRNLHTNIQASFPSVNIHIMIPSVYIYIFPEKITTPHYSVETSNTQVVSDMRGAIPIHTITKGKLFIPFMGSSTYIIDIKMFLKSHVNVHTNIIIPHEYDKRML